MPPPEIAALRELMRLRTSLVQNRTPTRNRAAKLLEEAGIKLASVASGLNTKSARAMMPAMVDGERDPAVLADIAQGTMRNKREQLELALDGRFIG